MLTIEEYLERAKYIGRIQGAAETIEDEATRDGLYGDAEYLFGYLVEDATEDDNERNNALHRLQEEVSKPVPGPTTNLDWLYHHQEKLVDLLNCPYHDCIREDETEHGVGESVCGQCVLDWLKEEHTDETN